VDVTLDWSYSAQAMQYLHSACVHESLAEELVCVDACQVELTEKILEYHDSGFIEDLRELFYKRSRCAYHSSDGQLQGEANPMNFDQHAGLYLLLVVGIVVCILLMFAEHAIFKWLVSYWRRKPGKSFWKSPSMMFWSQVDYLSTLCLTQADRLFVSVSLSTRHANRCHVTNAFSNQKKI